MMNKQQINYLRFFFVLFYMVGALGMLVPQTHLLFRTITPYALIMSTLILLLFHQSYSFKAIGVFILIAVFGFAIEVAGVNSGLIFGKYKYGPTLGPQWLNTPFLIGINWLLLTYTSAAISGMLKMNVYLQAILAAGLMLGYDFLLEPVAMKTGMWTWETGSIPLQNYIAWGVIALIFQLFIIQTRINLKNKLAAFIFGSQLVYLLILQAL